MTVKKIAISDINPAVYNPRTIGREQYSALRHSLKTFGQTENLIINKDGTLISGHMRLRAMKDLAYEHAYCLVLDLDKNQEKKLNVIMNSGELQGKYDELKLAEILEELKLDDDYHKLRLDRLEPVDLSEVPDEPEFEYSKELYEAHNYVVLYFDNDVDWQTAREKLNIKTVHDLMSKPGYVKKGVGRVLDGRSVIERIAD